MVRLIQFREYRSGNRVSINPVTVVSLTPEVNEPEKNTMIHLVNGNSYGVSMELDVVSKLLTEPASPPVPHVDPYR